MDKVDDEVLSSYVTGYLTGLKPYQKVAVLRRAGVLVEKETDQFLDYLIATLPLSDRIELAKHEGLLIPKDSQLI